MIGSAAMRCSMLRTRFVHPMRTRQAATNAANPKLVMLGNVVMQKLVVEPFEEGLRAMQGLVGEGRSALDRSKSDLRRAAISHIININYLLIITH